MEMKNAADEVKKNKAKQKKEAANEASFAAAFAHCAQVIETDDDKNEDENNKGFDDCCADSNKNLMNPKAHVWINEEDDKEDDEEHCKDMLNDDDKDDADRCKQS